VRYSDCFKNHYCKQMLTPETITSAANPLLKEVRRAVARGSLTAEGWCIAETFHLLEEALRSGCEIKTVLAAQGKRAAVEALGPRLAGVRVVLLPDAMFADIAATEHSQGVMALVQPREWQIEQLLLGDALVVVLDGLQDPGNAGAIVRAAEAFGTAGILFLKGTASPHNPKTLRASAGSLFRVPFVHAMDSADARAALRQHRIALFAAMPAASTPGVRPLASTDLTGRCALIIGGEARGVSTEWREASTGVSIPTVGVESLNASVAAGILLYEARRQRMLRR
jgi:RNA methyltransferase, TrmH family